MLVFVDVISVSVLYNCDNYCYQDGLQKARKEAKEGQEDKAITIKKEIVGKYEWYLCD